MYPKHLLFEREDFLKVINVIAKGKENNDDDSNVGTYSIKTKNNFYLESTPHFTIPLAIWNEEIFPQTISMNYKIEVNSQDLSLIHI